MSCCPPNSAPYLQSDYAPQGHDQTTPEDVMYYTKGDAGKGLIIIPDIWGYHGGRTRAIADFYSEKFTVIVPAVLQPCMDGGVDGDGLPPTFDLETRGGEFMAWIPTVTWDSVKAKLQSIFAVFALKGITNISIIGFCWGAWVAMRAAADFEGIFKAACCAHPAIHLEQYAYGGDLVALGSKVTIPVLLLPAGNDPEIYSEEGAFTVELKKNNAKSATTSEYKDMKHGFLPRGDLSDTAVASKVTQALNEMCEFICANN